MAYKCYSQIKLITDKYTNVGVLFGTEGIIIEVYDTGDYEVQFLDSNNELGTMFFSVKEEDITLKI